MGLVDAVGMVADALGILVVLLAFAVLQAGWTRVVLWRSRYRGLRRAWPSGRLNCSRATWGRVAELLEGDRVDAAAELDWLARCLCGPAMPDGVVTDVLDAKARSVLAQGYLEHASRLRARTLLGTTASPVIERDALTCQEVGRLLRSGLAGRAMPAREERLSLPGRHLEMTTQCIEVQGQRLALDLDVSHRRARLVPDGSADLVAPHMADDTVVRTFAVSDAESAELDQTLVSGRLFDGPLPRLTGWEFERDMQSGRARLHLRLAETSYSAVLIDSYRPRSAVPSQGFSGRGLGDAGRSVEGEAARLLTLSMVPCTRDGWLLLARRSAMSGIYETALGPFVNGNLELRPRRGVSGDVDASGLPDPLAALAREAREEVGLRVDLDSMVVTGLTRFSDAVERGTFVLTTTVTLPLSLDEVVQGVHGADLVEGRWEVEGTIRGLRVPAEGEDAEPLVRWLLADPSLTPHATAATLGALGVRRALPSVDPTMLTAADEALPGGWFVDRRLQV